MVGMLLAEGIAGNLASSKPLLGLWSLALLAITGSIVTGLLCLWAMKQAGRWPVGNLVRLLMVALILLLVAWSHRWQGLMPLSAADIRAFLSAGPSTDGPPDMRGKGVLDWDDDVPAWCIALASQPDDSQRGARVAALGAALRPAFEMGAFVPHDTQAAAADLGALSGDVAFALITSPRGRKEGIPSPSASEAARAWLHELPEKNPGDGHQYAMARAIQAVLPDLDDLTAGIEAALPGRLSAPGTSHAVSDLRNALAIAESLDLGESVATLRERVAPTLQQAWVDETRYRGRDAGFDAFPDEHGGIADALETHAAIELMAQYGVPPGIDVGALAAALEWRSTNARWSVGDERIIAAMDGRIVQATWPEASRPRFQLSDALFLLLLVLIAWGIRSISRQPLAAP
jgi:hypothetical protein